MTRLAEHTTLRLGGPARRLVDVEHEDELVELVDKCDRADEPVLILGGGSNLVVADEGFAGTVIRVRTAGITVQSDDTCSGATVRVAAGENWDDLVQTAIANGWVGIEALSGIPGLVGAAPMQNIGAYGQELADTVAQVRAYDRVERSIRTLALADCGFGYRSSRFKREPGRWLLLEAVFGFRLGDTSAPVRYAELARRLGIEPGERAPATEVREAVLQLRSGKGMVLDAADHDTWSAGSFFTNPIVPSAVAERLPADAPRWPQPGGSDLVKTSAAFLIERAGFSRGYGDGTVRLSSKHTLALTNRGGARTEELLVLAREVRDGVRSAFGIELEPEPTLVNCAL